MSEAFDFAKSQARRYIAEQAGKSTHSILHSLSDIPLEYEDTVLNLPVYTEFQLPLRDPQTGEPRFPAGYSPAGKNGAGM